MISETVHYPFKIVWLHWLTLVLIGIQLAIGYLTEDLVENETLFPMHLVLGFTIVFLTIFRFTLKVRLSKECPAKPERLSDKEWFYARLGHKALYALLIVTPVTGVLAWKVGEDFEEIHETVVTVFWIFIALHVLAVLKHYVIDKENLLKRLRF